MFEDSNKNALKILSNFVNSQIENPDLSEIFSAIKSLHTDKEYSSMARSALIILADDPYNYHEAQYEVGCCYLNGKDGFEASRELAFEYFEKSAKQDNFNAFLELSDGNEGLAFAWAMDNKKNHFLKYLIDKDPDLLLAIPDSKITALEKIIAMGNEPLFDYAWSKLGGKRIINAKSARGGNCVILSALNAAINQDFLLHLLGKFSPEEKSEFFYNQRNIFRLNTAESLILRRLDYDRVLIERADFSQEQIAKIRKIASSRAFLKYAYSDDGFFMDHRLVCDMQKLLLQRSKDESDQKFLDALQIIRDGKLTQIGDKKVKVKNLKYSNHDAFAIIICDLDDRPEFISYVDSYAPLRQNTQGQYDFGECRFAVKAQYQNLEALEKEIEALFKNSRLWDQPLSLNAALAKIARSEVSPDKILQPKLVSQSVPTKKQQRSKINCSYKSSNIAMRVLAQMMHPEMVYELGENGEPRGDLYDDYKKFRRKITDIAMLNLHEQLLTSAASTDEFDKSVYEPIVSDLEEMYEKALAKKDQRRIDLIDVVLQDVADDKIKVLTRSASATSLQPKKENHL